MADVPLSLAVISTITPVVAGALPLAVAWIKDTGRDKRAAAERLRTEQSQLARKRRAQCVKLLRMARDFRVLVQNTHDSSGLQLDAHAEQVRQSAADIANQADNVEFMIPEVENEALSLAGAAGRLAAPIADKKNRTHGSSLLPPDFTEFDQCLHRFKQAARAALGDQPAAAAAAPDAAGIEAPGRIARERRSAGSGRPGMGLSES